MGINKFLLYVFYPRLGRSETAKLLGVSERWVKRHASKLSIRVPRVMVNRRIRISLSGKKTYQGENPMTGRKRPDLVERNIIKPYALFPHLLKEPSNMRTLCFECHKSTDTYGARMTSYRRNYEDRIHC